MLVIFPKAIHTCVINGGQKDVRHEAFQLVTL